MESAVYEGHVRHRRFDPIERSFSYRVFMFYLDLDEIPEVMALHPLVSARPRSPASFSRADYLGPASVPLRDAVCDLVEERTGDRPRGPIRMLTNLRYLGLIENPVTFYFCFDPAGSGLERVVAEVTNTPWGDRHAYVLGSEGGGGEAVLTDRQDKALHVSPLMGMEHQYDFRFGTPGPTLPVHIESRKDGDLHFDATLSLQRTEISRATLGRVLRTYPPMSWRTTFAIYAQAAITWVRGVSFQPRPPHGRRPGADEPDGLTGAPRTESSVGLAGRESSEGGMPG